MAPNNEYLERVKFFESSLHFLEQELKCIDEVNIEGFVGSLTPSCHLPISLMLEDFVETSSFRCLENIHRIMQKHPLPVDNPDATKMGVLKLFNLFSRRQWYESGANIMARFMLLVAGAVRISDRSGVNLKEERNDMHCKLIGDQKSFSRLTMKILELQLALYSNEHKSSIESYLKLVSELIPLIASATTGTDDLITENPLLDSAPYLLIEGADDTIDAGIAVIILLQCLILLEGVDDASNANSKDIRALNRQIYSLLKKTNVGKRIIKMYPILSSSNQNWLKWKREHQCRNIPQHRAIIVLDLEYFVSEQTFPTSSPCDSNNENFIDEEPDTDSIINSDWAIARTKAFSN